jgi:hypothetical protein
MWVEMVSFNACTSVLYPFAHNVIIARTYNKSKWIILERLGDSPTRHIYTDGPAGSQESNQVELQPLVLSSDVTWMQTQRCGMCTRLVAFNEENILSCISVLVRFLNWWMKHKRLL